MNIQDYLIEQSGKDWSELLSGWTDTLPPPSTVWLVNRFGDVFAVFEDGSVHMLDVGTGVIQRLADSRDDFATQIDAGNNANHWLMIPLVDQCVAAGLTLSQDQCYGYKIPPSWGENTQWRTSRRQICLCTTRCWPIFGGRPKICPTGRESKQWSSTASEGHFSATGALVALREDRK